MSPEKDDSSVSHEMKFHAFFCIGFTKVIVLCVAR